MTRARSFAAGLLWLLVIALGGATLLAFLDAHSWRLELVAFFRLQYAVLLAAVAFAALALRRRRAALAAVAFALVNAAVVAPLAPAGEVVQGPGETVRVFVGNVQIDNPEHERMAAAIREADADVLVLTELTPRWHRALKPVLERYPHRRLALQPDAYGIGLYSRLPLLDSRVERFPRVGGPPSIVARVDVRGAPFTAVATHVHRPIEGAIHAAHLDALADAGPALDRPLAICGDFNTVPWATPFKRLAQRIGMEHLYERSLPEHTWPTWSGALRLTLDNCLVDGIEVRDRKRLRDAGSDHYPLVVELEVPRPAAIRVPAS